MENWKDIKDYEGIYQVSDEGRVRSLDREVKNHKEGATRIEKGRLMKPQKTHNGYLHIPLSKEGKQKLFMIHRLVWVAFNGEIPDGMEINHNDENKQNNKLENLSIMSHADNVRYGTRTERVSIANTNGKKSKPVYAYDINTNELIYEFPSIAEAVRKGFGYSGNICRSLKGNNRICNGYKWRYEKMGD